MSVRNAFGVLLVFGAGLFQIFLAKQEQPPDKVRSNKQSLELVLENHPKKNRLESLDSNYHYCSEDLQKFNFWIDSAFSESAKYGTNSLIVNKSAYALYLIKNGKLDSQYNLELGFNHFLDKQKEGDGYTPEGVYKVISKLDKKQTSFYRALLIN